jgi:hypothetical protein
MATFDQMQKKLGIASSRLPFSLKPKDGTYETFRQVAV